VSASLDGQFKTKQEESDYGFKLIMDIIRAAKNGDPYKEEIKEMWDIAYRNEDVMSMVRHTLTSLAKGRE
jgi:hypothetical protein